MTPLAAEIESVIRELAGQQALQDGFWIPRLASILEQLADIEFQLRMKSVDALGGVITGKRDGFQTAGRKA